MTKETTARIVSEDWVKELLRGLSEKAASHRAARSQREAEAEAAPQKAEERDWTDPLVHVQSIVEEASSELLAVVKAATLAVVLAPPTNDLARAAGKALSDEAEARVQALHLLADAFPDIPWSDKFNTQIRRGKAPRPAAQKATPFRFDPEEPLGFGEDCDCPVCSGYRQERAERQRTAN